MNIWKNRNFKPMLLKQIYKPFNDKKYIYEIKFDGYRALIFVNKNSILIQSRNGKDITHLYPELENIKTLVNKNVIFDGEIICEEDGKPSFRNLQKRSHLKNKTQIKNAITNYPVKFIVFDILYENKDITDLDLLKRKDILNKYKDNYVFVKSKYIHEKGIELFKKIKKLNLEGIVCKDINGKYHINKRTYDFIKIKNIERDEFYIGGYTMNKNNTISLLLGEYIDNKFIYVGKVILNKNKKIYKKIILKKETKNYFNNYKGNAIYIKPDLKCIVQYQERTKSNHLRHSVYYE